MNVLKLISPIPPSVNHYTKSRGIKRGNKISSFVYSTNEAKTYKKDFGEYVKEEVVKQNFIKRGCVHHASSFALYGNLL